MGNAPTEGAHASWRMGGHVVTVAHTICGYAAFLVALGFCLALHYRRVVKNHVAGWPDEFWPSVSATIGDWFPERNVFQILIAVTSGPRFLLVGLCALISFLQHRKKRAWCLLVVGVLRTVSCGGFVYITSTDHALLHDTMMGLYIGLTPLWMIACFTSLAPSPHSPHAAAHRVAQRLRGLAALGFYACTPFMVHLYLRHRQARVPGAYSYYSMFEWQLVLYDVLFDMASAWDLKRFRVLVAYDEKLDAFPAQGTDVSAPMQAAAAPAEGAADAAPSDDVLTQAEAAGGPGRAAPVWLEVLSQTYLTFTAWSSITCLISLIFYFSVSNMAAKGHELLVLSQTLGLLTLAVPPVRWWLMTRHWSGVSVRSLPRPVMGMLWAASFATIGSFVIRDPLSRLVIAAGCTALLAVISALDWAMAWERYRLNESGVVWLLGFLMLMVARYFNYANSPLWPYMDATNGGYQVPALVLGALSLLSLFAFPKQATGPCVRRPATLSYSWTRFGVAALALGTWFATLQALLSDAGTLIAYGWTGYPVRGPMAVPHGVWVIGAFAVGVLATTHVPHIGTNGVTMLVFAIGTALLFYADDWLSFAGGLGVASTLPTMGVPLLQAALSHDPLGALLTAWTFATVLAFLSVLTVAYAFLPGAWVMREHTGAMLLVQTVLLAAGLVNARAPHVATRLAHAATASRRAFSRTVWGVLGALVLAASVVPHLRAVPSVAPYHPEARVLTAGIWTVHFGFDQHMRDSTRRIESIVRELELDVLGLLETDLHRPAFGNRDLTQYLAERLGMYADLGPSPKKHTWGAVLLSKFPIVESTHHLLPSPDGELAPAIHAVLDVFGERMHVIVSHNGQYEDKLDRFMQTTEIARILLESYPEPTLFLGYVVTRPHAPRPDPYPILFEEGRILDVDPSDYDRWCQYLGFRGLERVAYARVSRYTVTDTELQTFKLYMPPGGAPPDRDVRPRRLPHHEAPNQPWAYPTSLIKPRSRLNETHMYAPRLYPQYFDREEELVGNT